MDISQTQGPGQPLSDASKYTLAGILGSDEPATLGGIPHPREEKRLARFHTRRETVT